MKNIYQVPGIRSMILKRVQGELNSCVEILRFPGIQSKYGEVCDP